MESTTTRDENGLNLKQSLMTFEMFTYAITQVTSRGRAGQGRVGLGIGHAMFTHAITQSHEIRREIQTQ